MARNAFKSITSFLRLMRHLPPEQPGVSKAGARMVRQASHVFRGGTLFTGTSATDKVFGKALAEGHNVKRYGDPGSKRPVVGHGGRPPIHRRQSGWVTAVLILLMVLVVISLL